MIMTVPNETAAGEKRVAATPDTVRQLLELKIKTQIQTNAGTTAGFSDSQYEEAGAVIVSSAKEAYNADIILKIRAPEKSEEKFLKPNSIIIADFQTLARRKRIKNFARIPVTCFALDMIPRISRAQSMDILSSQSNLAGYKAVIDTVSMLDKAVPMMITAAGTVAPAKFLILGAGVAGLQAIATAKRLGAQVFAFDVRPQVKEQVESLGGKFIEIAADENYENKSGYAVETSDNYKQKQNLAIREYLQKSDIVITTALIPGQKAPRLISKDMFAEAPNGCIIFDMAAEQGGNVEGSVAGKTLAFGNITLIGADNPATQIPYSASLLYARNIFNFLMSFYKAAENKFDFAVEDEIAKTTCICRNGQILLGEK